MLRNKLAGMQQRPLPRPTTRKWFISSSPLSYAKASSTSTMLSRALLWTCCCSFCAHSFADHARISRMRPPLAFMGHNRPFRGTTPVLGRSTSSKRFFSSSSSSSSASGDTETNAWSLETLAHQLADAKYSKIVALVGAGASCSAGIPDFRTPGTGLYDKLDKYNLPMPESIFDLDYYTQVSPLPFVDLCQEIWPGQAEGPQPTPTHHFLKLLQTKGLLHRIYTQNIDGLESLAGISSDALVECHGQFRSASCTNPRCKAPMPIEECRRIMVDQGKPPICEKCGSLVKPNIVFFGEEMPSRFMELIDGDAQACDLLLVFGTSLLVMPVAGIPSWVSKECPRVLFNREPAGGIGTGISKHFRQDLFLQGDCDDRVRQLCELAGWETDLQDLVARNDDKS